MKNDPVYDEDVEQCLFYLKNGEEFTFALDENKNEFCQFNDMSDHDNARILVTLTPDWYGLTYIANKWNPATLKSELERFYEYAKTINNEFIATKFTVEWR